MKKIISPLLIALVLQFCTINLHTQPISEDLIKIGRTLNLIDAFYVDSVKIPEITEKMIINLLRELDPRSVYISAKNVKEMNEPLNGNFEGIGVQFNLLRDSIVVIEPIPGGPSEKVGIRAGDRIIVIDGEKVTGIGISTTGVRKRLMGLKGTKVDVTVYRPREKEKLDFTIIRDKIPINSVDAAYMLDKETGYIKLNKFAATTETEFNEAMETLRKKNMKNIVIDLRSNGGGYMLASTSLAEKFFADKKLIVYLEGRKTPRQDYTSSGNGDLSSARVVVLTDEASASASEIFAGALQDWDRGVIIGRRTFGKGLVQNQYMLPDGSMIRLTIARYYTPTGRLIQSPYNEGYDKYMENFYKRYSGGEMLSADSIHFPDSLKYQTLVNKRTVYGGGGITPDVFVPVDTSNYSDYYRNLVRRGVINQYALEYSDKNRTGLKSRYPVFDNYLTEFTFSEQEIKDLIKKGEEAGVKYSDSQFRISRGEILTLLKALVASNIWQTNEYFLILNQSDPVIKKALEVISDRNTYNKILGY
ncbi:MAG: S41 family peptidase [Bacteroidales bacterium]|nr:S41 family peptidase [Bacteroidales bacterium]